MLKNGLSPFFLLTYCCSKLIIRKTLHMKQIQKLSNKVIPIAKAKKTKCHFPVIRYSVTVPGAQ